MSDIEWTDLTRNPIAGCSKESEGCDNCYAIFVAAREMSPQHRGLTYRLPILDADGEPVMVRGQPKRKRANWTGDVRMIPSVLASRIPRPRDGSRKRVFMNSMSDMFHPDLIGKQAGRRFVAMIYGWMIDQPHGVFQILTKRPEQMRLWMAWLHKEADRLPRRAGSLTLGEVGNYIADCLWWSGVPELRDIVRRWLDVARCVDADFQWPPPNVVLGVTAENQAMAEKRIPELLAVKSRGDVATVFVSYEPALGPVNFDPMLCPDCGSSEIHFGEPGSQPWCVECDTEIGTTDWLDPDGIDWIICGGESGTRARPMHPDWARRTRDQCRENEVPFLFKQWGEWGPETRPNRGPKLIMSSDGGTVDAGRNGIPCVLPVDNFTINGKLALDGHPSRVVMARYGKKVAGRELDGRTHDEFPEVGS